MKKYLSHVLPFLVLMLAAVSAASAQKVGAYKEIVKSDPGAAAAAVFAVKAQAEKAHITATLVAIEQAERQLVAGTNYRLCLNVTTSDAANKAEVTDTVRVVVYRDMKGKHKLMSWVTEDCTPDGDD